MVVAYTLVKGAEVGQPAVPRGR